MKILIANLGSTSFKFRLYDMTKERLLARGGVDRIGAAGARAAVKTAAAAEQQQIDAPDHAAALRLEDLQRRPACAHSFSAWHNRSE